MDGHVLEAGFLGRSGGQNQRARLGGGPGGRETTHSCASAQVVGGAGLSPSGQGREAGRCALGAGTAAGTAAQGSSSRRPRAGAPEPSLQPRPSAPARTTCQSKKEPGTE